QPERNRGGLTTNVRWSPNAEPADERGTLDAIRTLPTRRLPRGRVHAADLEAPAISGDDRRGPGCVLKCWYRRPDSQEEPLAKKDERDTNASGARPSLRFDD